MTFQQETSEAYFPSNASIYSEDSAVCNLTVTQFSDTFPSMINTNTDSEIRSFVQWPYF
jgi:hypothetical protein